MRPYHHDHLSTRAFTDAAGNSAGTRGHYPFGEFWYETGSTDKWKFTTYERDNESSLDYAMFRYDSSRLGRFLTPDPLAGSLRNPQSLNRYAYVRNDPINRIDPLGLLGQCFQYWVPGCNETGCIIEICVDTVDRPNPDTGNPRACVPNFVGPGGCPWPFKLPDIPEVPKPGSTEQGRQQKCAEEVVDILSKRDKLEPFEASRRVQLTDVFKIQVFFTFTEPMATLLPALGTFHDFTAFGHGYRSRAGQWQPGFELQPSATDPFSTNPLSFPDADKISDVDPIGAGGHAASFLGHWLGNWFGKGEKPCDILKKLQR